MSPDMKKNTALYMKVGPIWFPTFGPTPNYLYFHADLNQYKFTMLPYSWLLYSCGLKKKINKKLDIKVYSENADRNQFTALCTYLLLLVSEMSSSESMFGLLFSPSLSSGSVFNGCTI